VRQYHPGAHGPLAVNDIALSRSSTARAIGDIAADRPWTYYKRHDENIDAFLKALQERI